MILTAIPATASTYLLVRVAVAERVCSQIQRTALGGEQRAGVTADRAQGLAGNDQVAILGQPVDLATGIQQAETLIEPCVPHNTPCCLVMTCADETCAAGSSCAVKSPLRTSSAMEFAASRRICAVSSGSNMGISIAGLDGRED